MEASKHESRLCTVNRLMTVLTGVSQCNKGPLKISLLWSGDDDTTKKIQNFPESNISLRVTGSWLEVYKSKVANPWLGLGEFGPHCICG